LDTCSYLIFLYIMGYDNFMVTPQLPHPEIIDDYTPGLGED